MKLYTAVVFDLRMCMMEGDFGLKKIKGDNSIEFWLEKYQGRSFKRDNYLCGTRGILCDLAVSSSLNLCLCQWEEIIKLLFIYRDKGMKYLVGNDWMDLMDIVVVNARKPKFFNEKSR